jgi:BASS family bile acid:Na+ symporter
MFELYPKYEELLARLQLTFFMVGMGATLVPAQFLEVFKRPRSLIVSALGQLVVIPFLAYGLAQILDLEAGIALGLILVAAMPGGTLSKVFTFVGRGNVALSITLSVVTTLAAIITVPLLLRLLASEYIPPDFDMPILGIIHELALFLLLPLGVGMVLGRAWPKFAKVLARWCVRIGFVVVVIMVVGSLGSGRIRPAEYGLRVPLVIILFCLLGQQVNMLPFRIFPWPRQDRLAAGIEVTMRNMNLALLLLEVLFPPSNPSLKPLGDAVLFVVLFYAAVAMGAGLPLALNHRRMWRREVATANEKQGPVSFYNKDLSQN